MKKRFAFFFTCACLLNPVEAGEIPLGLRSLLDKYTKDSAIAYGFIVAKTHYAIDSAIHFQDIRIDKPIEVYAIDYDKLEKLPDSTPVKTFISPTGSWQVFVRAKEHYLYALTACSNDQSWYFCQLECCASSDEWEKIRRAWPESKGGTPFLLTDGGVILVHFPEKGGYNLTFFKGYFHDSTLDPKDYTVLSDSKKVIAYLKKRKKENEKWLRENPLPALGGWSDSLFAEAQKVPKELQRLADGYIRDSLGKFGFKTAKKRLHLNNGLRSTDLSVGKPFKEYVFNTDSLDKLKSAYPVDAVLQPTCNWKLPVLANGAFIYIVSLNTCGGSPVYDGLFKAHGEEWRRIEAAWSEKNDLDPILIKYGTRGFIYSPSKSRYQVSYITAGIENDPFASADSVATYDSWYIAKLLMADSAKRKQKE